MKKDLFAQIRVGNRIITNGDIRQKATGGFYSGVVIKKTTDYIEVLRDDGKLGNGKSCGWLIAGDWDGLEVEVKRRSKMTIKERTIFIDKLIAPSSFRELEGFVPCQDGLSGCLLCIFTGTYDNCTYDHRDLKSTMDEFERYLKKGGQLRNHYPADTF